MQTSFRQSSRRRSSLKQSSLEQSSSGFAALFFLFAFTVLQTGCDQLPFGKGSKSTPQEGSPSAAQAEKEALAKREAEKNAAEERERKKREAEALKDEKKRAQEAVAACCQELAKTGFESRSMEFMAATDVCQEAQKQDKLLSDFASELKEKLGESPLPPSCTP